MSLRLGFLIFSAALFVNAQPATQSNSAYRRYREAQSPAERTKAAEEWLETYERENPDPKNLPPYLIVARLYVAQGIHLDELPVLLEKAVNELANADGYTARSVQRNAPFQDDIDRALAANVYTQIHQDDKAHALLERVGETVAKAKPETFDQAKARIFEALLFSYRDSMARLAIAEGRKEDALALEHAILTNPKNVAAPSLIEEHRAMALGMWRDLGHSESAFQTWLSADH